MSIDFGRCQNRVVTRNAADSVEEAYNLLLPQHHSCIVPRLPVPSKHQHAPSRRASRCLPRTSATHNRSRAFSLRVTRIAFALSAPESEHAVCLQILFQQLPNCRNLVRLNCRKIANRQLCLARPKNVSDLPGQFRRRLRPSARRLRCLCHCPRARSTHTTPALLPRSASLPSSFLCLFVARIISFAALSRP